MKKENVQMMELCLRSMYFRDLAKMATAKGIKGSWSKKKADLIDEILKLEMQNAEMGEKMGTYETHEEAPIVVQVHKETTSDVREQERWANKARYVENAEVGAIVAFKRPSDGKARSAMIKAKSSTDKKLRVETNFGREYIINFSDVIWVRTGKRWPKGVYMLLKGMTGSDEAGKEGTSGSENE